jgi:hypothetical protein
MKVKELIDKLQKLNGDLDVFLYNSEEDTFIDEFIIEVYPLKKHKGRVRGDLSANATEFVVL